MIAVEIDPRIDSQMFRQDFENRNYLLKFIWNERASVWQFELYTPEEDLIASAPLVTGIDLFSQHRIYGRLPPGRFIALNLRTGRTEIKKEDVGVNVKLFYIESGELRAIIGA